MLKKKSPIKLKSKVKETSKKSPEKAKAKGKEKAKVKDFSVSKKEVLNFWKENLPKVINTKQLSSIVNSLTSYSLGEDLTASAKNLRRHLRTLPQYNDDSMTYYAWNRLEEEDLQEVLEIVGHYQKKAKVS
jgi:hypothetical protein